MLSQLLYSIHIYYKVARTWLVTSKVTLLYCCYHIGQYRTVSKGTGIWCLNGQDHVHSLVLFTTHPSFNYTIMCTFLCWQTGPNSTRYSCSTHQIMFCKQISSQCAQNTITWYVLTHMMKNRVLGTEYGLFHPDSLTLIMVNTDICTEVIPHRLWSTQISYYVPHGRWPTGHYVSELSVRPALGMPKMLTVSHRKACHTPLVIIIYSIIVLIRDL